MDTELFDMKDIDWAGMRNYIAQYNPSKLGLMGEPYQKCFMITSDGPCGHYGMQSRVFCVFRKFIISYMIGNGCSRQYDIESHTLSSDDLRYLKHFKLCYYKDDMISKVMSRLQQECTEWKIQKSIETCSVLLRSDELISDVQKEKQQGIYRIQKMRQQLKKDEDDLLLQKQMLHDERHAFEKEKHALETELAKYKGIVENCMKEISSYEF